MGFPFKFLHRIGENRRPNTEHCICLPKFCTRKKKRKVNTTSRSTICMPFLTSTSSHRRHHFHLRRLRPTSLLFFGLVCSIQMRMWYSILDLMRFLLPRLWMNQWKFRQYGNSTQSHHSTYENREYRLHRYQLMLRYSSHWTIWTFFASIFTLKMS